MEEFKQERMVLDFLKYKTLQAEIVNTDANLQTLRCVQTVSTMLSEFLNILTE